MERHYFEKNFNLDNLTNKLLRFYEKDFIGYEKKTSWFAISADKKTLLLVIMMESKGEGFKHLILDLLSLEKSFDPDLLRNATRLEMPVMKRPLVFEGEYLFCNLQGWSLEIGLVEQEKPCQTIEEAKKFIEAYAFCEDLFPSINQYAWGKKCMPQKGKLGDEEVFYVDIERITLVIGYKCRELWEEETLIRD